MTSYWSKLTREGELEEEEEEEVEEHWRADSSGRRADGVPACLVISEAPRPPEAWRSAVDTSMVILKFVEGKSETLDAFPVVDE